jgi:hypothetical protein
LRVDPQHPEQDEVGQLAGARRIGVDVAEPRRSSNPAAVATRTSVLIVGMRAPVSNLASVGCDVRIRPASFRWERPDTSRATRIT